MKKIVLLLCIISSLFSLAQKPTIDRIDPPFWWTGMKETDLQLMIKGANLKEAEVSSSDINIASIEVLSDNYLIVNLDLTNATSGDKKITIQSGKKKITCEYQLKERQVSDGQQGLDGSDVLYLIMPDRFANGDPSNDNTDDTFEKANRTTQGGHHGGDLKGIRDRLDYIADLGVTAVWLNPVYENNMNEYSYHGYSITDHYRVDPRYGTMTDYKNLVNESHERGLKVVKDMIFNHVGSNHFWMEELPTEDWLNQWPEFTQTSYTGAIVTDPYASEYDFKKMVKGWFVGTMPDLNQDNQYLMNYLTQQSIWWIEHTGIDGIRMDTYVYASRDAMIGWVKAVKTEYPDFFIVGETWLHAPSYEGYWQARDDVANADGYNSGLQSVSDFPLYYAVDKAFGKNEGLYKLYEVLTQDFTYPDASQNKIFIDNHDVDRFFYAVGEDISKLKMALTFLLTTRGMPQLFYGTEILMNGHGEDGIKRADFPGGWEGDERDAFTVEGRTEAENEAFNFMQKLLNWRKSHTKLFSEGGLTHFMPVDDVYVYSRFTDEERIVVILNGNSADQTIDLTKRYGEFVSSYSSATDVVSGIEIMDFTNISLKAQSALILELK